MSELCRPVVPFAELVGALAHVLQEYTLQTTELYQALQAVGHLDGGAVGLDGSDAREEDAEEEALAAQRELQWLQRRAQRLHELTDLLQQMYTKYHVGRERATQVVSSPPSSAGQHHFAPGSVQAEGVLFQRMSQMALRSVGALVERFKGSPPLAALPGADSASRTALRSREPSAGVKRGRATEEVQHPLQGAVCRAVARPFSIPEATFALWQRRTKVAVRRDPLPHASLSGSLCREVLTSSYAVEVPTCPLVRASEAEQDGVEEPYRPMPVPLTAALSRVQREERLRAYTGRTPFIPALDRTHHFLSPARLVLSRLTLETEGRLVQHAWKVCTRGQLLSEWDGLQTEVQGWHQELQRKLGAKQPLPPHGGCTRQHRHSYLRWVCTGTGVLRVHVQRGLMMDLTYDMWRREWRLLELHWTLFLTSADAGAAGVLDLGDRTSFCSPFPMDTEEETLADAGWNPTTSVLSRLLPDHTAAMYRLIQESFVSGGLRAGCATANQLCLCVVLDTLASQLKTFHQLVFIGPLQSLMQVEVLPSTKISFAFQPPEPSHFFSSDAVPSSEKTKTSRSSSSTSSTKSVLHGKIYICGGALLLEHHWGTDLTTQSCQTVWSALPSLVRTLQPPHQSAGTTPVGSVENVREEDGLVVEAEQLLWGCFRAKGSREPPCC